ncbi:antitoxin [Methanosarcinales archaeon]|nr:MAG: antitoxin [Methanosarcinales archaeon]
MKHQKIPGIKTLIVSDPNICGGEPCIRDTRIPVHIILGHLAAGEDYDTILKNFPHLKYEDILACLEYAAYLATEKAVYE